MNHLMFNGNISAKEAMSIEVIDLFEHCFYKGKSGLFTIFKVSSLLRTSNSFEVELTFLEDVALPITKPRKFITPIIDKKTGLQKVFRMPYQLGDNVRVWVSTRVELPGKICRFFVAHRSLLDYDNMLEVQLRDGNKVSYTFDELFEMMTFELHP